MNSIDHFSLSDTLPGFNLGGASTAAKPEEKKDGASTATAPAAATGIFRLHLHIGQLLSFIYRRSSFYGGTLGVRPSSLYATR